MTCLTKRSRSVYKLCQPRSQKESSSEDFGRQPCLMNIPPPPRKSAPLPVSNLEKQRKIYVANCFCRAPNRAIPFVVLFLVKTTLLHLSPNGGSRSLGSVTLFLLFCLMGSVSKVTYPNIGRPPLICHGVSTMPGCH